MWCCRCQTSNNLKIYCVRSRAISGENVGMLCQDRKSSIVCSYVSRSRESRMVIREWAVIDVWACGPWCSFSKGYWHRETVTSSRISGIPRSISIQYHASQSIECQYCFHYMKLF